MSSIVIEVLVGVIAFAIGYAVGFRQAKRGLDFIPKKPSL